MVTGIDYIPVEATALLRQGKASAMVYMTSTALLILFSRVTFLQQTACLSKSLDSATWCLHF